MLIAPTEFNKGVEFTIEAETEAERLLLTACVDPEAGPLAEGDEDTFFTLSLPVSN